MLRGDHKVNDIKLTLALNAQFRQASPQEIEAQLGPPGSIGPVGVQARILLDDAVLTDAGGYVAGANRPDLHLRGVVPGRDFHYERGDVRNVVAGDTVGGNPVRIEPAIEVGNIFKLGTRYSVSLGAALPRSGRRESADVDGLLRNRAGADRRRRDRAVRRRSRGSRGRARSRRSTSIWSRSASPTARSASLSDSLYEELQAAGLDTLYDERDAGPGEKFADAELLGCPLRVTIGRRTLQNGEIEVQVRRGQESRALPLEGAASAIADLWRDLA